MAARSLPRSQMVTWRGVAIHPRIAGQAAELVSHHGDVRVTSGWRSVEHNRRVGGADLSRHLLGLAIDVAAPRRTLAHLAQVARQYGATEVLLESDHLHLGWPRAIAV